jgi:hypothetical protein
MKVVNPASISVRKFVPRSENLKKPPNAYHPSAETAYRAPI